MRFHIPERIKVGLLIGLPILIVAVYIWLFGVNFPLFDQWENIPLLMKVEQGQLSLQDLFSQHNEHRPFFPRTIWLSLAAWTHYNIRAELWVNFVIMLVTFLFFLFQTTRFWRKMMVTTPIWLLPLLSLLVFNLGQRESWLQGFQTIMFLGMACVVIGIFLLAESRSWVKFIVAILLGWIANFSMVNSIFYWFVGVFLLIFTLQKKITSLGS